MANETLIFTDPKNETLMHSSRELTKTEVKNIDFRRTLTERARRESENKNLSK